MLTQIAHKTNDIIILRTLIGEEFVGRLISDNENTLILSSPFRLGQSADGRVGLMPFSMLTLEDNISFYKLTLLCRPYLATLDIEKAYLQATSGLII